MIQSRTLRIGGESRSANMEEDAEKSSWIFSLQLYAKIIILIHLFINILNYFEHGLPYLKFTYLSAVLYIGFWVVKKDLIAGGCRQAVHLSKNQYKAQHNLKGFYRFFAEFEAGKVNHTCIFGKNILSFTPLILRLINWLLACLWRYTNWSTHTMQYIY